jgi:hypothetical protein
MKTPELQVAVLFFISIILIIFIFTTASHSSFSNDYDEIVNPYIKINKVRSECEKIGTSNSYEINNTYYFYICDKNGTNFSKEISNGDVPIQYDPTTTKKSIIRNIFEDNVNTITTTTSNATTTTTTTSNIPTCKSYYTDNTTCGSLLKKQICERTVNPNKSNIFKMSKKGVTPANIIYLNKDDKTKFVYNLNSPITFYILLVFTIIFAIIFLIFFYFYMKNEK